MVLRGHSFQLPVPDGWSAEVLPDNSFAEIAQSHLSWIATTPTSDPLSSLGLNCIPIARSSHRPSNECPSSHNPNVFSSHRVSAGTRSSKRTWRTAGLGAPLGVGQSISEEDLRPAFATAFCTLVKDALKWAKSSSEAEGCNDSGYGTHLEVYNYLEKLLLWQSTIRTSGSHKNSLSKTWFLFSHTGIPGILFKTKGNIEAVALQMRSGLDFQVETYSPQAWYCSPCCSPFYIDKDNHTRDCFHSRMASSVFQELAEVSSMPIRKLYDMIMSYSAGKRSGNERAVRAFGENQKTVLSVVRSDNISRLRREELLHVAVKNQQTGSWRCITPSCSVMFGLCSHALQASHINTDLLPVQPLSSHPAYTPTVHRKKRQKTEHNRDSVECDIENNKYCSNYERSLVPVERGVEVDEIITRVCREGIEQFLPAPTACRCGEIKPKDDSLCSWHQVTVECMHGAASMKQEEWTCSNGHLVWAEEDEHDRQGLVWISRFTAYTEMLLFHSILVMVFGGATATSIATARSTTLNLRGKSLHRSEQSFRKAIFLYTSLVVKGIPPWIFRCEKCVGLDNGLLFYDQLAFDGLAIGYKATHQNESSNELAADSSTATNSNHIWRVPVRRVPNAAKEAYLIDSKALRIVVFEALRARAAPADVVSEKELCRAVFTIKLDSKEIVTACVAAVKLFDQFGMRDVATFGDFKEEMTYAARAEQLKCPEDVICGTKELSSEESRERYETVSAIFSEVVDCRRVARVICTLLLDLKPKLRGYIPPQDLKILQIYRLEAIHLLQSWITRLSMPQVEDKRRCSVPVMAYDDDSRRYRYDGISEHASLARARGQDSFEWSDIAQCPEALTVADSTDTERLLERYQVCLRPSGSKKALHDTTVKLILMLSAALNEPACVWMRKGGMLGLESAMRALRSSKRDGTHSEIFRMEMASESLMDAPLLYHGVLSAAGSASGGCSVLVSTVEKTIGLIADGHRKYEKILYQTPLPKTRKKLQSSITIEPSQFDREWLQSTSLTPQFSLTGSHNDNFMESGVWAPDFPVIRPSPFGQDKRSTGKRHQEAEPPSCIKNYSSHNVFSPGTFVVTCLCHHPKCVAVVTLKKSEGCRMPLNFIIERTARLPSTVVYDFACGTMRSALGISAELLRKTNFVIDRFHFRGHKACSLALHANSHASLTRRNTASQEQRNSLLRPLERTLRGASKKNFMNFTILAHALQNGRARFRDILDTDVTFRNANQPSSAGRKDGIEDWAVWLRNMIKTVRCRGEE